MKTLDFNKIEKPYFIADIAANHDGELQRAKDLVWIAKESGADCAKFQHFLADKIVNDKEFKKISEIKTHQSEWKKSVSQIYDDYHFKREWTDEIHKECIKANIDFSSTPYDLNAIKLIEKIVPFIKIGSGDISWIEHIMECAKTNLPIIIATGASDEKDVDRAMSCLEKHAHSVCIMQCNTNYTTDKDKIKYVNLKALNYYRSKYPFAALGLSDHTLSDTSVIGAISLGAMFIEKHFTDDNSREGPDHKFAINPKNWKIMVQKSQEIYQELGNGKKKIEENELNAYIVQRRSCVAKKNLSKGHIICKEDIDFLRPCPEGSVQPYEYEKIIGKRLKNTIEKNESFLWTMIL